jgi:hypothetical protein
VPVWRLIDSRHRAVAPRSIQKAFTVHILAERSTLASHLPDSDASMRSARRILRENDPPSETRHQKGARMMFDTSTYPQSGLYGLPQLGQQGPFGQPQLQLGQQGPFGQSQLPGFVPIVSLVPQSLLVSLVVQSLQQAQLAAFTPQGAPGHPPGQFGAPQLGWPIGQPQFLQSPWQASGGWGGQSPYAGAFGRGVLGYQAAPHMAYAGQPFAG